MIKNESSIEYLSLIDIVKILKKKRIFILLMLILCTSIMTVKEILLSKPMYQAYATAIIVKGDSSIVQNSKAEMRYTQDDISLYEKIIDTYVQIAQSNLVIDETSEMLKDYSSSQIKEMVTAVPISSQTSSASGTSNTQIIELSAVSNNRNEASKIANAYCKSFIKQSMDILPVGKIQILDQAKTPSSPISTNKYKSIAAGFLFGLVLSAFIIFFTYYLDSLKIKDEKQITNILNIPVLLVIE
ncbi:YveK family protein [Clostridium kluyveri]|uniref:YveK family protein n=1 Tax=Clostridium kluyveri TaxID=1534 RepID=UPI00224786E5|nr:Wzz/FepE/Etk N-terminal domain-containing protein [Clostridium kluyveri]UZQ50349.1 Wzz/FepE/Etk N-terminal domain-containing protein [Clostridium kluyveri]